MVINKMFNPSKASILAAILVAYVSLSAASPAEVTIFPKQSSTEINSFTSYEVTVENTGPTEDVYTITSSNPSEITIAPRRVPETGNLKPGESRTVNVWYNPGPEKDAGTYSFQITATSRASGDRFSATGTVSVIKDHEVSVDIADSKTACLGEKATYTVNVTNKGIQEETFELTTRHGKLSKSKITLAPGETRQVALTASSDKELQKNFNVIAASTSSYAQEVENVQFNVETCYASDVTVQPKSQRTAAFTEAEYDVTVKNTGTRSDTYVMSSNLGNFQDTSLQVPAGASKETTLTVRPESIGNKKVEVTAKGKVSSKASATLESYNGMDASVNFQSSSYSLCETESREIEVGVRNTGEADETFNITASKGKLSDSQLELDVNESEEVELTVNASKIDGASNVTVSAVATTFGKPGRSDTASVKVENCYDLKMNVVPQVASAGKNRSVIYEVQLQNNGTKENTYNVSADGPEWISVKPSQVTVKPGKTGKAYIYAGIPFGKNKGRVDITANAVGTQVRRSQTVKLLIGEKVKDAIDSGKKKGPTGGFARLPDVQVTQSNLGRIAASVIIGLLITAAVIYREW